MMSWYRARVEYDGSAYHGWQVQKNAPSVQAALEAALERLAGEPVRVRGAGRTDAGVHARGQTILFCLPDVIPAGNIAMAVNSRLPADIAVHGVCPTDPSFDPRRQCVRKQYTYSIACGPLRPALAGARCWHIKWNLDPAAMQAAAAVFVGTHDFTSYCNGELAADDNVRTVDRSEVVCLGPDAAGRQRYVYFVEGRSFLYNMVRALTGAVVEAGSGKVQPGDIRAILDARSRSAAGQSAPARGLCLEWTLYAGEEPPPDGTGLF